MRRLRSIALFLLSLTLLLALASCSDFSLFEKEEERTEPWVSIPDGVPTASQHVEPQPPISPDDHISHILSLLGANDPQSLLAWLTEESLQTYGEEQVVNRHRSIHSALGVTTVQLGEMKPIEQASDMEKRVYEGNIFYATHYGDLTRGVTYTFLLNRDEGRWELDWTPSVIMPGLSRDNQIYIEKTTGVRGAIYDRTGKVLAQDVKGQVMGVDPATFDRANIGAVAALFNITEESINDNLDADWAVEGVFVPLARSNQFTGTQLAQVTDYHLIIRPDTGRVYPEDAYAAHLTGYVTSLTAEDMENEAYRDYPSDAVIGRTGLERVFEDRLRPEYGIRST